jgi:predicted phosphodiesterase
MTYVISDIHGYYEQYRMMLQKIRFNDNDVLYVLGDVVDWGANPVEVLRDMSKRPNVIPIMGNHEYYALEMLSIWKPERNFMCEFGGILCDVFTSRVICTAITALISKFYAKIKKQPWMMC